MKIKTPPKVTRDIPACTQDKLRNHWWKNESAKRARTFFLTFAFAAIGFISSAQTWQTLCWFTGANGANPSATLTLGPDGNLYGTTPIGGLTNSIYTTGMGTVFKVTTNGTLITVATFNGLNGLGPQAALTPGPDGNLYGTTVSSIYGASVFKIATNGALTTVAYFNDNNNPVQPQTLTLGSDGSFYGVTENGGSSGLGTVFNVTTNGHLNTLASLSAVGGAHPYGALTLGPDCNFYGTTQQGGNTNSLYTMGMGIVFKVMTNGELTALASFSGTNGLYPTAALTLGPDGNFYGTTKAGGSSGQGTVFKVTTNGALTTLVSFSVTNGATPLAAMTLGADGNLYGTTAGGGNTSLNSGNGYGTVFKMTTNGTLSTLISFPGYDYYNGDNGAAPYAGLTLGSDGNFYGTTSAGGVGSSINGTVFRLLNSLNITAEPTNLLVQGGATASFNVVAASAAPLNYQWTFDGTNITGATNSTLIISNVDVISLGNYQVLISNGTATTNSSLATLTMSPSLVSPFGGATTVWGKNVTLSVGAVGSGQLNYQWFRNGLPIAGANNPTLNFASIQFTNAGLYSVVVNSAYGSITNAAYQVVVNPANVSLGFCPSLTIGGVIGYSYIIQSTTNLANPNAWSTLTNLILTQPVQLWVDTNANVWSPNNPTYFYRVLPGQ